MKAFEDMTPAEKKAHVKGFNQFTKNIRKQLNSMYEESKRHLEDEKSRFYSRGIQPVDRSIVLGRSLV